MKKVVNYFVDIFVIIIFMFSAGIFIYKISENVGLLVSSQEIVAKIQKIEFKHHRRSTYCNIDFEYKIEESIYTNHVSFNWLFIDRVNNFINNEYRQNGEIEISIDRYGNCQVKKQIKKELFLYLLYLIISISFFIFFVRFYLVKFSIKGKNHFYIQDSNYKIKNIKTIGNIADYIAMLKNKEIICFGIGNNSNFVEYSYTGKEFVERKSNNSKETEKKIANDFELEKIVKLKLNKINKA